MSNFEDSMKATVISSSKSDPPETDLDYYSRPENYTGSNLQSLQRFIIAKDKQEKSQQVVKKLKKKKEGFNLFERYKHILKGYVDEPEPSSSSSEDEGEGEEKKDEQKDVGEAETLPKIQEEAEEEGEEKKEEQQKTQEEKEGGLQTPDRLSPEKIPSGVLPEDGKSEMSIDRMSPRSPGDMTGSPRDSIVGTSSKRSIAPSSGRQSMMMKAKMQTLAKEVRQQVAAKKIASKKARERFKKAYKFVRIVMTLSSSAAQSGPSDGKMKTFTDIANEAETTACISSQGLSFDPNYFKAKKEEQICGDMSVIRSKSVSIVYCQIQISTETKNILCLPSDERTPEQIQTAMYGLQSLRSFAEYPLHMQEKLAKVAWYEVVPPKRIIIRQGHFAENFYFILSGQAVVTLLLRDPKTGASFVKTATIMRKGMSFGELALLHHSRRTATVTSQGLVQLLTIGREDFFDIFMSGQGPDELPEHIKFISQCDFFEHWPLEELVEHPEQCLLHFFKRNVVVVKDSTQSEWIYVVKSGSCIVLKQLKGVTARLGRKTKLNSDTKLPKLQMAPAKVDTGLRKRRQVKSAGAEREIEKDIAKQVRVQTPISDRGARETEDKHFSKSQYSKFPATHKAYFSPLQRPPAKKPYEIPKRCKPPKRKEPEVENTGKPPPVFVQVDVLKPKDAFGLETIDFDDGIERPKTVVTLVSQGAECVMMSKAFFAKHANERVKRWIRHQIRPYPIDETFQENLQIKVDWELYKADLINDLTSRI